MAKRSPLDATFERLAALRDESPSPKGIAFLRKTIGGRSNLATAKAAAVAREWMATDLAPDLAATFRGYLERGPESDKGCDAKLAIVACLHALNYEDDALYLAGVRHVQMEAAWGPPEDTAPALRGACLQALAITNYGDVHFELARLLADPEMTAHRNAIQTALWLNDERSELLLRMDALVGNRGPAPNRGEALARFAIFGDIFQALMSINTERNLSFVADFLADNEDPIFEGAALAIGESKHPAAFPLLKRGWDLNLEPQRREALLLPFALHRGDEAFEFLLEVLANERLALALRALEALGVCASSGERRARVDEALGGRSESKLHAAYKQVFEG